MQNENSSMLRSDRANDIQCNKVSVSGGLGVRGAVMVNHLELIFIMVVKSIDLHL